MSLQRCELSFSWYVLSPGDHPPTYYLFPVKIILFKYYFIPLMYKTSTTEQRKKFSNAAAVPRISAGGEHHHPVPMAMCKDFRLKSFLWWWWPPTRQISISAACFATLSLVVSISQSNAVDHDLPKAAAAALNPFKVSLSLTVWCWEEVPWK